MNHHAAYRLEIHAMESGKWYATLIDSEMEAHFVWESQEYETMEDAYDAGKYEWDSRVEVMRELVQSRKDGDK